jgi:YD repeat-containing protein
VEYDPFGVGILDESDVTMTTWAVEYDPFGAGILDESDVTMTTWAGI